MSSNSPKFSRHAVKNFYDFFGEVEFLCHQGEPRLVRLDSYHSDHARDFDILFLLLLVLRIPCFGSLRIEQRHPLISTEKHYQRENT